MSHQSQRRLHPQVRIKTDGTPVNSPSPWREWNISEMSMLKRGSGFGVLLVFLLQFQGVGQNVLPRFYVGNRVRYSQLVEGKNALHIRAGLSAGSSLAVWIIAGIGVAKDFIKIQPQLERECSTTFVLIIVVVLIACAPVGFLIFQQSCRD